MGICGGLGKYLEIDGNAIRLTFVVLAAWNGLGVLLYLATILIVPEEPLPTPAAPAPPPPADPQDEIRRVQMLGWLWFSPARTSSCGASPCFARSCRTLSFR